MCHIYIKLFWIFLYLCTSQAFAQENLQNHISVTGTAVTKVVPDIIQWQISVHSVHNDLSRAKNINDQGLKNIMSAATKANIEQINIQTGYLNVRKEYDYDQQGRLKNFQHYTITRHVYVTQNDITSFDVFFSDILKNENLEVSYELATSKFSEIRKETRIKALLIAKEKAENMSKTLEAQLGTVLLIEENVDNPYSRRQLNAGYMDSSIYEVGDSSSGVFAPGTIEVRASVDVIFELK